MRWQKASRLRVYVGENECVRGRPVYEAIVLKARELHLAGATVIRGSMGFGSRSLIHSAKILRLSEDLPVVIEIVDRRERLEELLNFIDTVLSGGAITLEEVECAMVPPSQTSLEPR